MTDFAPTTTTYDCDRYATADEAFDAWDHLAVKNGHLFQVARFGFGPFWYAIEIHKVGCAGFELVGYVRTHIMRATA